MKEAQVTRLMSMNDSDISAKSGATRDHSLDRLERDQLCMMILPYPLCSERCISVINCAMRCVRRTELLFVHFCRRHACNCDARVTAGHAKAATTLTKLLATFSELCALWIGTQRLVRNTNMYARGLVLPPRAILKSSIDLERR